MKKLSVSFGVYLWLIFLCLSISAQDFKTIRDGIEYAEVTREIDKLPVRMNLLRLDLTKVRLDVAHAKDAAIGLEKTSSIALRHGAIAAINAGFFRIDKSIFEGDDTGALRIDKENLSEPFANRIALFITNKSTQTEIFIDHFFLKKTLRIKNQEFEISGLNRQRKDNEIILFTPFFHRTTLTDPNGIEITVRKDKITGISDGKGSTEIPDDGFVISATGRGRDELLKYARLGLKVGQSEGYNMAWLKEQGIEEIPSDRMMMTYLNSEDMVSGVPQLIRNGRIDITWQAEKSSKSFVETKHPRTAVAKLKDGKFLMVTVDGRSESSGGIGLQDLAQVLLDLGATDAMNLDGGGSTTMFLDGKVVNHPSDKEGERSIASAILVFPRL